MKEKILCILNTIRPEVDFARKTDFFDDGFRDSMDFVRFVESLNSTFNIEIDGMDILPENFINIDAIEHLLSKYLA